MGGIMIQMYRDGETVLVTPTLVPKYVSEGYLIDFSVVKEVYNYLIDVLNEENNSLGFSRVDDLDILNDIYNYSRTLKDILEGKINYPQHDLLENINLITKFVEESEKLKRLRITKIIRKVLMDIHSNNIDTERIYKYLTENEVFIYTTLIKFIDELINKMLFEL